MRRRICFDMAIPVVSEWGDSVHNAQDVVGDHWIGILVNGNGCGRMGNINAADTVFNTTIPYHLLDLVGDGNKLSLAMGAKFDLAYRPRLLLLA